ncbi:DUF2911 domain-containing protein [Polaribacter uvawellassae]|uniref:DUF2911 domain-containing protein n=1 Tax=Polaribacter uvawellassae TaxID=3133495 RepID=UPI003219C599
MKKNVLVIALFAIAVLFSNETTAQKFDPLDKSPMDAAAFPSDYKNSNKIVKVVYSRPQLNGRNITKLVPEGKMWRTGANQATEITFYKDVKFGGKSVSAGTYSLFTIPGEKEWTIVLSSAKNVWGAYFYKETEDVVRVKGKVMSSMAPIEAFSMTFDDDMNLYMGWGYTVVKVTIK